MNSTMITVPDWARDFVKNYASTAYNLMNKLSSVPTVSIRNGTGAQLLPTVDFGGTGSITSVTVTNSGSHLHGSLYMMVSDPTGTGAILSPVLSDDGSSLVSITLVSGGSNYSSSPVILFTDMKTYMDGEDFYYWGNFSDFDAVSPAATAHVGSGKVISCAVINGGIGYVAPVKINFPGGSAAASALVVDGVIVSVTITNQGNEYTSVPTANIQSQGGGAQAVAVVTNGEISSIVLTFGGAGYIVTPGVYISGGNGTGAAAHATVANGVVTQVTMDSGGSGYTVGSSEVLPYPGTVVATQPAHETDGITALASRGKQRQRDNRLWKDICQGID